MDLDLLLQRNETKNLLPDNGPIFRAVVVQGPSHVPAYQASAFGQADAELITLFCAPRKCRIPHFFLSNRKETLTNRIYTVLTFIDDSPT